MTGERRKRRRRDKDRAKELRKGGRRPDGTWGCGNCSTRFLTKEDLEGHFLQLTTRAGCAERSMLGAMGYGTQKGVYSRFIETR